MEKFKIILLSVLYGILLGSLIHFVVPILFYKQYYIVNGINSTGSVEYNSLLTRLYTARSPLEVIHIEVRSEGGYVDGTSVLVNAIKRSNATVEITVNDFAYSGGALLLCNVDRLKVSPGAIIMYHLPRHRDEDGKVVIIKDPFKDVFKQVDIILAPCIKYFTEAQLESYYNGNDVYLTAEQFKDE